MKHLECKAVSKAANFSASGSVNPACQKPWRRSAVIGSDRDMCGVWRRRIKLPTTMPMPEDGCNRLRGTAGGGLCFFCRRGVCNNFPSVVRITTKFACDNRVYRYIGHGKQAATMWRGVRCVPAAFGSPPSPAEGKAGLKGKSSLWVFCRSVVKGRQTGEK